MFQFNYSAPPIDRNGAPADGVEAKTSNASPRLVLSWAEHCVECAAPACYATCDLFTPTEAGKCRRIEGGIVPLRGRPGAKVEFRKWGKLEAQGNGALQSPGSAKRIETALSLAARAASRLGPVLGLVTGDQRWTNTAEAIFKRANRWLWAKGRDDAPPNQLTYDIENCGQTVTTVVLTIAIDKARLDRDISPSQLPPPFSAKIKLSPGPNRGVQSLRDAAAIFGSHLPYNLAMAPLDEDTPHLVFHELEVERRPTVPVTSADVSPIAALPPAKLVVFDLDNTLWDGVLLEGTVRLRDGVSELFEELDQRGILISIASKNAHDDAIAELERAGLTEYLLFPQIGWLPKSRSIAAIVEAIDIGIDTVIFIDDNPFERAEVSSVHPRVEVIDDKALGNLASHPRLQGAKTPEARARRSMYQNAIDRSASASQFGGDYIAFLESCEMEVSIRPAEEADHARLSELVQRTNQLNFSGRKYSRDAISQMLDDSRLHLVIDCADKFGSYGTVGFCVAHFEEEGGKGVVVIDDFMLSCRVQGKFVEKALVSDLIFRSPVPVSEVRVDFRKTERNRPAQLVLEEIGFASQQGGAYALDLASVDLSVTFMTIRST